MINRLRSFNFYALVQSPRELLIALGWAIGLALFFAFLANQDGTKLIAALSFLVGSAAATLVIRFTSFDLSLDYTLMGLGIASAIGLIALPQDSAWTWWMGLAAMSVTPLAFLRSKDSNLMMIYALITVGAALVGALLGDALDGNWDSVIMGLGMMASGQGFMWMSTQQSTSGKGSTTAHDLATAELEELTMRIHVTVDGLVRASQAINEVMAEQSGGAAEQADVIKLTNDMMEDFLKLSEQVNEQARTMTRTAQQTAEISENGKVALQQAIEGMDQIREQVNAIGTTIVTLAQLTRRIDEIITSVSEVATQSNLLALNASIEAARAGVHGRGFAVVADEVRSLSQQSTNASHQVRMILAEIQEAVKRTVSATETGMSQVDGGVEKTRQADEIMKQLGGNVNASNRAVRAIYEVISQQSEGLEEISISMERINRITQQNLTSTQAVATVSNNLTRFADDLQKAVQSGQQTIKFTSGLDEVE
jgi:methyl-accepting chemotaxis protein